MRTKAARLKLLDEQLQGVSPEAQADRERRSSLAEAQGRAEAEEIRFDLREPVRPRPAAPTLARTDQERRAELRRLLQEQALERAGCTREWA